MQDRSKTWAVNVSGIAGLLLLGAGLWKFGPEYSSMAIGVVLLLLSIWGALR